MNSQENQNDPVSFYISQWTQKPFDDQTIKEVKAFIKGSKEDVDDAFKKMISFGTGGMREKMGFGPNRMNKYTISLATQALANHITKEGKNSDKKGVVVCHDCRNHSREFAMQAAVVLAGNNIPVYITENLRPTPFCSYAIRHLNAISGINITASHNPAEYNGYKVYWEDGGQVVSPHDSAIVAEIANVEIGSILLASETSPLIQTIDKSVENSYLDAIYTESIYQQQNKSHGKDLSICYSPLHGAGITMIPSALEQWGFSNLTLVESQKIPNGDFPTTKTPNPETPSGRACGIETLKASQGDLLLISDPDSDRLSVSMQENGHIHTFTGNELGIIFLHFLLKHKKLSENFASITTIVSTPLCKKITEHYGGKCFEVLTGFKYIAKLIKEWERKGPQFILGFEESLGYLSSTKVRDKDAVLASCQITEIALHLKKNGTNLFNYLMDIYKEHGIYREGGTSIAFSDKSMLENAMTPIMESTPSTLFDKKVIQVDNYATSISKDLSSGKETLITLPKSKVVTLHLEDGSRYIIRPSGTEPLIKIYASVHEKANPSYSMEENIQKVDEKITSNLSEIKDHLF